MGLRRTHSPGRAHEHVNQMALLDELLSDKSNLICLLIFMFLAALTALYTYIALVVHSFMINHSERSTRQSPGPQNRCTRRTCAGDQASLVDQRAGGPENLLALRAEGTRASS